LEKPKLHQLYWYIELYPDGTWNILQRENTLSYDDVYNIATHNCFATFEECEDEAFSILLCLTGLEEESVTQMMYEQRRLEG